jgi:hypothetical protein
MSDASVSIVRSIAEKFKGSYDIAGVAEALLWQSVKFQWRTDVDDFTGARTFYDLICVRRMTCYEFVHFCAYFAGQQRVASSGNPIVSGGDSGVYVKYSEDEWDPSSRSALLISRNRLILGKAPFWNNQGGYFHVGICIGCAKRLRLLELRQGQRPLEPVKGFVLRGEPTATLQGPGTPSPENKPH